MTGPESPDPAMTRPKIRLTRLMGLYIYTLKVAVQCGVGRCKITYFLSRPSVKAQILLVASRHDTPRLAI